MERVDLRSCRAPNRSASTAASERSTDSQRFSHGTAVSCSAFASVEVAEAF